MIKNLKNIKSSLKSSLSKDRYQHTLGVAYTAMCLAMKYEVDLQKAEVAGLLHDCAKCIPNEKKLKECTKHNIKVSDYIEPGRNRADNLPYIRKLAFEDIDRSVYIILKDTLEYLQKKGGSIDVMTNKEYEFYRSLYE